MSDLGLGKVGVWGGLQGLGSAREQAPQNLKGLDPMVEGGERAASPHTPLALSLCSLRVLPWSLPVDRKRTRS